MERPHQIVPDRLLRDSRRDAWILVLPAGDFLTAEPSQDVSPSVMWMQSAGLVQSPSRRVSAGVMERVLPFVMLVWATVVWTFLFYELGHL